VKILKVGNVDVLLDEEDWLRLCGYRWRIKKVDKYSSYVVRTERRDGRHFTIYMHREIMNTPKGMECHHKEGNAFDNRKEMLENLTKEEHMQKNRELSFETNN